jgi:uncharacterized cupin superfamily protein
VRKVNVLAARPAHRTPVGELLGADEIGACLYDLAEGERGHPYHFHPEREEWAIVVSGSPTLRAPAGERALREGDVVCFRSGPDGAHQLTGPGTVLVVSDNRAPDVAEYPDSGKLAVGGRVFRLADAVDLTDDE